MTFVTAAIILDKTSPDIAGISEADSSDSLVIQLYSGNRFRLPTLSNWRSSLSGHRS